MDFLILIALSIVIGWLLSGPPKLRGSYYPYRDPENPVPPGQRNRDKPNQIESEDNNGGS